MDVHLSARSLLLLDGGLAVVKLPPRAALPAALQALLAAPFASITYTAAETSLVLPLSPQLAAALPAGAAVEGPWRALRVAGQLDFALTGVLCSLLAPLAAAAVSAFALSTFDTDYLLVKEEALPRARAALEAAGCAISAGS